jgi:uncharacterized membrane protein
MLPGLRSVAMDWLVVAVQWLHVLLGIFWFGTSLSLDLIVIPAINRLPIVKQREIASLIGARASPIFRIVVPAIVVLGFLRGTVFGPIKTIEFAFTTAYGITWLVALVVTIGVWIWGLTILEGALRALDATPLASDGSATPEVEAATNRVKRLVGLELLGFMVIFTCMILMRFGL